MNTKCHFAKTLLILIIIAIILAPFTSILFPYFEETVQQIKYAKFVEKDYEEFDNFRFEEGWIDFNVKIHVPQYYGVKTPAEALQAAKTQLKQDENFVGILLEQPQPHSIDLTTTGGEAVWVNGSILTVDPLLKDTSFYSELDKEAMCKTYTTNDEVPIYLTNALKEKYPVGTILNGQYSTNYPIKGESTPRPTVTFKVIGHVNHSGASITEFYDDSRNSYSPWGIAVPVINRPDGTPLIPQYERQQVKAIYKSAHNNKFLNESVEILGIGNYVQQECIAVMQPKWNSLIISFILTCFAFVTIFAVLLFFTVHIIKKPIFKDSYSLLQRILLFGIPSVLYFLLYNSFANIVNLLPQKGYLTFTKFAPMRGGLFYIFWVLFVVIFSIAIFWSLKKKQTNQ